MFYCMFYVTCDRSLTEDAICRTQVAIEDRLGGRLSDVDVEKTGRQIKTFVQQHFQEFMKLETRELYCRQCRERDNAKQSSAVRCLSTERLSWVVLLLTDDRDADTANRPR